MSKMVYTIKSFRWTVKCSNKCSEKIQFKVMYLTAVEVVAGDNGGAASLIYKKCNSVPDRYQETGTRSYLC